MSTNSCLLSLLCVAATEGDSFFDEINNNNNTNLYSNSNNTKNHSSNNSSNGNVKTNKGNSKYKKHNDEISLTPDQLSLSSSSISTINTSSSSVSTANASISSPSISDSTPPSQQTSTKYLMYSTNNSENNSPMDSDATQWLDSGQTCVDDPSTEDEEVMDSNSNSKKRKRLSKHQSRRAKPLTVDTLHQIFDSLHVLKDSNGTYRLSLPQLKTAECSSKYFAVTEWQCFRKRIMNHGFEIVDEQQASWIRVRPNLQTVDGILVFENPELRNKYSTPCKIKSARERGEVMELPCSRSQELFFYKFTDPGSSESDVDENTNTPPNITPEVNATPAGGNSDSTPFLAVSNGLKQLNKDESEKNIETTLKDRLHETVHALLSCGEYTIRSNNFEIKITYKQQSKTKTEISTLTLSNANFKPPPFSKTSEDVHQHHMAHRDIISIAAGNFSNSVLSNTPNLMDYHNLVVRNQQQYNKKSSKIFTKTSTNSMPSNSIPSSSMVTQQFPFSSNNKGNSFVFVQNHLLGNRPNSILVDTYYGSCNVNVAANANASDDNKSPSFSSSNSKNKVSSFDSPASSDESHNSTSSTSSGHHHLNHDHFLELQRQKHTFFISPSTTPHSTNIH